nr:hypothetical protein Iba_chr08aCG6170 [Ipomoea batatas]
MTFMDSLLKTKWKNNMSNKTAEVKILHERKWINVKREITNKFQKNKMVVSVVASIGRLRRRLQTPIRRPMAGDCADSQFLESIS